MQTGSKCAVVGVLLAGLSVAIAAPQADVPVAKLAKTKKVEPKFQPAAAVKPLSATALAAITAQAKKQAPAKAPPKGPPASKPFAPIHLTLTQPSSGNNWVVLQDVAMVDGFHKWAVFGNNKGEVDLDIEELPFLHTYLLDCAIAFPRYVGNNVAPDPKWVWQLSGSTTASATLLEGHFTTLLKFGDELNQPGNFQAFFSITAPTVPSWEFQSCDLTQVD